MSAEPTQTELPPRPRDPERPCPVCGTSVEPLRAPQVVLLEDGFRYLCSAACRERFAAGERRPGAAREHARASSSASWSPKSDPVLRTVRKSTRPRASSAEISITDATGGHVALLPPARPPPLVALGLAGAALAAALFATTWTLVGIAAVCVAAAALVALVDSLHVARQAGIAAWLVAPAGALLVAASGLLAHSSGDDARVLLAGAAFASAVAALRSWLDAASTRPVDLLVARLRTRIPARVRVPAGALGTASELASTESESGRVRVGEEIVAIEGDVVPVDGVVRAGHAYVIPHPSARAPLRREVGDPIVAGARVVEGTVRVLATRVGADRAMLRALSFGDGTAADVAPVTRIEEQASRFGGVAVIVLGLLGIALGETGGGLAARLAAAASALLAVPLLAVRRAARDPYVAAGATAAERGIIFASARALDRAGRVEIAAVSGHGTLTEGHPEVVEVHAVGDSPVDPALGLAASAELAAPDHPVGRALVALAQKRGIARVAVRRVVALPGRGVTALGPDAEVIAVGSRQLLLDEGVSTAAADDEAVRAESRGQSVVFVAVDRRLRALVCLRDEDRPGARAAVQRLIDLGIEVQIISGDHRGTVEAIARGLDVTHVKAELGPAERGAEVRRLRDGGDVVASVGRAGLDEDSLSAADVPVVLGAAGGQDAERAITLTGDDVRDAAAALWLAHWARRAAVRGVAIAVAGGVALGVLGAVGLLPPVVVAVGVLGIDVLALPSAARFLRRVELRLPARG